MYWLRRKTLDLGFAKIPEWKIPVKINHIDQPEKQLFFKLKKMEAYASHHVPHTYSLTDLSVGIMLLNLIWSLFPGSGLVFSVSAPIRPQPPLSGPTANNFPFFTASLLAPVSKRKSPREHSSFYKYLRKGVKIIYSTFKGTCYCPL